MNIKQIVLDVLEKNETHIAVGNDDNLVVVDKNIIAKSISNKIKAVSIDRDEVKSLLFELENKLKPIHRNEAGTPEQDQLMIDENIYYIIDKILSLLKPAKTLNRRENKNDKKKM